MERTIKIIKNNNWHSLLKLLSYKCIKNIYHPSYKNIRLSVVSQLRRSYNYYRYSDYLFLNRENITIEQHNFVHRLLASYDISWGKVEKLLPLFDDKPLLIVSILSLSEQITSKDIEYIVYGRYRR